jgi:hypothetical protein
VPLSATTLSWLAVLSLAIGLLALVAGCVAWSRAASVQARARRPRRSTRQQPASPLSSAEVTEQIEALQVAASSSLRHLAVVRYDAFGDMGGAQSFSVALLDADGNGLLLTSINARSETRTYCKAVRRGASEQTLSPEEREALDEALQHRTTTGRTRSA